MHLASRCKHAGNGIKTRHRLGSVARQVARLQWGCASRSDRNYCRRVRGASDLVSHGVFWGATDA